MSGNKYGCEQTASLFLSKVLERFATQCYSAKLGRVSLLFSLYEKFIFLKCQVGTFVITKRIIIFLQKKWHLKRCV